MDFIAGFTECRGRGLRNKVVDLVVWDRELWFIFTFYFCFHVLHGSSCSGGSALQICSKLYEKEEERGIDPSRCAQLFQRNSRRIPTETGPNQWSLCAHLLDFLLPVDTALSVPCNPGPASASSSRCCRILRVAF